jgi:hypothetical protein
MNPMAIRTTGIPEDVLTVMLVVVFAVILACAALVVVTNYRDKVKDRSRKAGTQRAGNVIVRSEHMPEAGPPSAPPDHAGLRLSNSASSRLSYSGDNIVGDSSDARKEQGDDVIFPKKGQVWTQKERARAYALASSLPLLVFLTIGIVNGFMPMILVAALGLVGALMIWLGAERDRRGEP